ncbi:uncharacterized protein LOC129743289 [Uranotaenia lowii]|uniref:uncharacterized protein LOC129743289 n=1 Tax=Uranotaenia lowii TaxID=190385 RepID=UPI00247AFE26|nr:uncharacterized protein LOC129743289 [Uranotaenia lowii]
MHNRLKFLLNCRKCKIVPKCLDYKISMCLDNEKSKKELRILEHKQKIRMVSLAISDTKRTTARLKPKKKFLSEKLQNLLDAEDWRKIIEMVSKRTASTFKKTRKTEIRKLDFLKKKKILETTIQADWIENTTTVEIPDYLERALLLGPNFNIQPTTNIPYVAFIADVESAIKQKPDADDIRSSIATMINNYVDFQNQPRAKNYDWIHKDVIHSRKFLREHNELIITKADKGNKTVVMLATEYSEKMTAMVSDTTTYTPLTADPTEKILKRINTMLDLWHENKYITTYTKNKLKLFNCPPPRIYGLPKIHKEDRPLRPVVSTVGSATYRMAQFLANVLQNVVGKTEHHVRSSFDFASEITNIRVPEGYIIYSLDVVSLYTNVPIKNVYEIIEQKWREISEYTPIPWTEFKRALQTILGASFFQYNGKIFEQTFGTPMGSPLSPVVASLLMEQLEERAIQNLRDKDVNLVMYKRYVDDCLIIGKESDIDHLNNQKTKSDATVLKKEFENDDPKHDDNNRLHDVTKNAKRKLLEAIQNLTQNEVTCWRETYEFNF